MGFFPSHSQTPVQVPTQVSRTVSQIGRHRSQTHPHTARISENQNDLRLPETDVVKESLKKTSPMTRIRPLRSGVDIVSLRGRAMEKNERIRPRLSYLCGISFSTVSERLKFGTRRAKIERDIEGE